MTSTHLSTRTRRAAVAATAAVLVGGVAACAGEGDVPDELTQDVESLSEELGTLDDRITALEDQGAADVNVEEPSSEAVEESAVFADPSAFVGEDVTLSGEITELYDTTDAGAAFQIVGPAGDPIPVVSTDPPEELLANDSVLVTGTVVEAAEASFEEDFGIAMDDLLNNTEGFLVDAEGQPVVAAESVEKVSNGD